MSKYIFAIEIYSQEEQDFSGVPYNVVISTKAYFDKEKCLQDNYSKNDHKQIASVFDKYGLMESQESYYECMAHTAEEIKNLLSGEPLFTYSKELQDFIDAFNNDTGDF